MKRFYTLFTLLLTVIASPAYMLALGGKCGGKVKWEFNQGLLKIYGEGPMKDYGKGDTPWRPDMVKYLEIDDGITYIGKNCFAETKIASVKLPLSVVDIGTRAFAECKSLMAVELPYGLKQIGNQSFANCRSLSKITIPASVVEIADRAFYNCHALEAVSIPARIQSIGVEAFGNSGVRQLLEIPDIITLSNCNRFGIALSAVEQYYKEQATHIASTEVKAKSEEKSAYRVNNANTSAPKIAYGQSDVDRNIPSKAQNNVNTFAIIIANENYSALSNVPYALNDGSSFATYCRSVLGIPDQNIGLYKDATYLSIKESLAWLRDVDNAFKGDIDVIFYYAGHGVPDEATRKAYIVPTDAFRAVKDVCYPLDDLYASLGSLKAKSVKVFLDACFSGATPDGSMIENGRTISVVPKESVISGNTVVLSATTGEQTAWQYDRQGHGVFTYYLLKKLQETSGDVSMGELCEYVCDNVNKTSIVENKKSQNPSVSSAPNIGSKWRYWTVK